MEGFDLKTYLIKHPIQQVQKVKSYPWATESDVEVATIWAAMFSMGDFEIAWRRTRDMIAKAERKPFDFVYRGGIYDVRPTRCLLRTMKGENFIAPMHRLRAHVYNKYKSIRELIVDQDMDFYELVKFLVWLFQDARIGEPFKNSSCKRLCLLLYWMIRPDDGICQGLWKTDKITPYYLKAVLDPIIVAAAIKNRYITYNSHSWRAVEEMTAQYKRWSINDPLQYHIPLQQFTLKNI